MDRELERLRRACAESPGDATALVRLHAALLRADQREELLDRVRQALDCRGEECPRCAGRRVGWPEDVDSMVALLRAGHPVEVDARRLERLEVWLAAHPQAFADVAGRACLRADPGHVDPRHMSRERWRGPALRRAGEHGLALRHLADGWLTSTYLVEGQARVLKFLPEDLPPLVREQHLRESLRRQESLVGLPGLVVARPSPLELGLPSWTESLLSDPHLGGRTLPRGELLSIGRRAAWTLAAVHGLGDVHGDLRPSRIHVASDGRVTLRGVSDPWVAYRRDPNPPTWLDAPGARIGPVACRAPEAFRTDRSSPTPAEDVFSLAVLLRMSTGDQPYESGTSLLRGEGVRPWSDPSPLARVLTPALALDPAARPSMAELARELDRIA